MEYQLEDDVSRIKFAREGAAVHRVHAQPGLHPYQVGMHTFNMLTMCRVLKPDASAHLLWAIIEHDIPERVTCDVSHPAKAAGIINRDVQDSWENYLNILWSGNNANSQISDYERSWLNGLDMLEFYCFCKDQLMMGNRMYTTKKKAVENYMKKYAAKYPKKIIDAYWEIKSHEWHTLPDIGGE